MTLNDFIGLILNIPTLIAFLLGAITVVVFLWFTLRKEIRLFSNIRRPIMIFKSPGNDMECETQLLRRTGFFKVDEPTDKHQMSVYMRNHALVVIGWSPDMPNFDEIWKEVKARRLPVIVYGKNLPNLGDYSLYCMCQTPLRLVNDVFGILSTFRHE